MKSILKAIVAGVALLVIISCNKKEMKKVEDKEQIQKEVKVKDILGNPDYLAISYGGYRHVDHDIEPTIDELKEDMKLLSAIGVGILRTYKLHLPHAANVLKAISDIEKGRS